MKLGSEIRWWWLCLIFAALAVVTALAYNIAVTAYDAAAEHVFRGVIYSQAVSDGVWYPRWVQFLHGGLGSPIFTFQGPLPYAAMDMLYRLGFPHPIGWRILIAFGFLAAFAGAFLLVYEITRRRWPAFLAAVAFLYAPYVIRNALERGSNETYSMFLYPWVLWSLLWLARRAGVGRFLVAVLVWSVCIASHVLAPLILAPFALLVAGLTAWRWRTLAPLLALVVGGLLTAMVWAPMAPEQAWVHVERDFGTAEGNPLVDALPLDRLLDLPAVYDVARDNNQTGVRVGLLHTLFLLLGVPGTIIAWTRGRRGLAAALGAATLAGLMLFFMFTSASNPVWRFWGSILLHIQYRSRLMGVQALAAAAVAGLLLAFLPAKRQPLVALILALALALAATPSLYVRLQHHYQNFGNRLSLEQIRAAEIEYGGLAFTAFGEFTPRWHTAPFDAALAAELGPNFDPQNKPLAKPSAGVEVRAARVRSSSWELDLTASTPQTITLYLHYYPRWQAFLDGMPTAISYQEGTGLVQVSLPAGEHRLALRYASTGAERAGLIVSGLTALSLLALGGWALRRRGRQAGAGAPGKIETRAHEPAPALGLLLGLSALLVIKFALVDPMTTWFRCVSTAEQVCGAQATVEAAFAGGPGLRGYAVSSPQPKPGQELRVNLYWQGESEQSNNLHSFVHVRNSQPGGPNNPRTGNEIWAQDEHYAPGGVLTTQYLPGRLYRDEFRVRLPEDIPPGEYFLEIGWFNPQTGEQLEVVKESLVPPLRELWRSILLPPLTVR